MAGREVLEFESTLQTKFDPYLRQTTLAHKPDGQACRSSRPFVTLTYAVSLDSQIAAAPGVQTVLSGASSKAMTHYLRTRHDAIAIGAGTAVADNPTLNSRLRGALSKPEAQPRPVVFDRSGRWDVGPQSKVIQAALSGHGKAPWILVDHEKLKSLPNSRLTAVEEAGGAYMACKFTDFAGMLTTLFQQNIDSVMVEGGGIIINDILNNYLHLVDSVIVTIAPVYLGQGGVKICPPRVDGNPNAIVFDDVTWVTLANDVVMCGRPRPVTKSP